MKPALLLKELIYTALVICTVSSAASALEMKIKPVQLPPVDGSTFNGSTWVVK